MMRALAILTVFSLLGAGEARGQETNARPRWDDGSFRFLAERNIFNPNRGPRSARPVRNDEPDAPPPRTESFALVGTITHTKGRFAFFEGSSAEYRKVLPLDGTIAGYKVSEISAQEVTLSGENEKIKLPVGSALQRRGTNPWEVGETANSAGFSGAPTPPPATSQPAPSTPTTSAPGDNDVLKRLMQKREQELSNEKR